MKGKDPKKVKHQEIFWPKTGTNLVIMGDLLIGGSMDKRGSMSNAVAHNSVANKTVANNTMPNHSRGPEDLRGRIGGGCKGCQSKEGLKLERRVVLPDNMRLEHICTFILGDCSSTDREGLCAAAYNQTLPAAPLLGLSAVASITTAAWVTIGLTLPCMSLSILFRFSYPLADFRF